eukprot:4840050-Pyramimonas_sp.AAC.1
MYGLGPNHQSEKYQDHLNRVLPEPGPLYTISVPGNWNAGTARRIIEVPFRAAFESIDSELRSDPTTLE